MQLKLNGIIFHSDLGLLAGQLYQSFWKKVGIEADFRQLQVGPQYIGAVWYGNYDIAFWRVGWRHASKSGC